ncbi:sugar phosphate isomerase/epimerase [Sphingobacterium oryzagri]|uniref:Sugar phosphate isomerase/epimerase n=1 Tax=Sphingobacterium oryzagri TaxID=3025669 RepID=A0ABY7WML7_9SPHI|nr:sugar phosphate isomerase/epimerase [Sphingobacterium sp. KACC 22765]WDF70851.1 sugar phosphate isomerase/epimerase [Sphingobacterium sp. KACC 22765]
MKTIKGPAIFLAQFMDDTAPFNNLDIIGDWLAGIGYKAVQIPTWDSRCIDLENAASSKTYADELLGGLAAKGLSITELSVHLQSQLVATHPAYDKMFDGFAPAQYHNNPTERTAWAERQVRLAAQASANLGLHTLAAFSGALLWHTVYPWPQRPNGLVDTGFKELAKRWLPLLDVCDEYGVDIAFELHPGEDLHDGITFERFLDAVGGHKRANILYDPSHFVLQQLDYLQFIDFYHERIKAFHVKDAEFLPNGKSGVYGGYQDWIDRPGRFRSLGDGQVDFKGIFSKLSRYGFDRWAVIEWECCIKDPVQGAQEGVPFVNQHIIEVTKKTFDDFANAGADEQLNKHILGLS